MINSEYPSPSDRPTDPGETPAQKGLDRKEREGETPIGTRPKHSGQQTYVESLSLNDIGVHSRLFLHANLQPGVFPVLQSCDDFKRFSVLAVHGFWGRIGDDERTERERERERLWIEGREKGEGGLKRIGLGFT